MTRKAFYRSITFSMYSLRSVEQDTILSNAEMDFIAFISHFTNYCNSAVIFYTKIHLKPLKNGAAKLNPKNVTMLQLLLVSMLAPFNLKFSLRL